MSRWRYVGVLMGTAGLIVACEGGGGSTGGASSGGGGAGSVDAFITEYCGLFQPCCAAVNKPYDEAKCRVFLTALTAEATYDASKGQQCLNAARAEANGTAYCEDGFSEAAEKSCDGVFTQNGSGTKQPGEPCESDSECAGSAEGEPNCASSFTDGQTIRRCQILVKGKEGDDCVGNKTENTTSISLSGDGPPPERATICYVPDGLFCDTRTKKCTKTQDVGGPCDVFSPLACVATAYCDTTAKTCVARKGAGQECTGSVNDECADKHYCDTETKKCTPTIPAGQPCTKSVQCERGSCTNGKCSGGGGTMVAFVCAQ